MNEPIQHTPSGFPMLDMLTGGYPTEGVTVVRYMGNSFDADMLQKFMERQALNFSLEKGSAGKKTLLMTLQMTEKEIARSLALSRYISNESLCSANLYISAMEEGKRLPTWDELIEKLDRYIFEDLYSVVIIDGIDKLIPKDSYDKAEEISAVLVNGLLKVTRKFLVPLIVTDYENDFETDIAKDEGILEITLNRDVNDRTQATIENSRTVIEDIYSDTDTLGVELIRSAAAYRKANGRFPSGDDELTALVNAGAAISEKIDDLLTGRRHD